MPRQLVLVGGGHTHALLLYAFAENPLPDTRIVLVSDVDDAPYSGMLPGHVAGFYSHREMHIDLPALCGATGAEFIKAEVCGFDPDSRAIRVRDGSTLELDRDWVSFNVGSHPRWGMVPGAEDHAIPSKPVPKLLEGWERIQRNPDAKKVILVGGGAGGVELALSMRSQLPSSCELLLIHAGEKIMEGHAARAGSILSNILKERGVSMLLGNRVTEVAPGRVTLDFDESIEADAVFWVTTPAAPGWLGETGLALSEKGFIRVKPTLQTVEYPWIFAAGDVAAIEGESIPRSGVYAVRMAKPLEANLRAMASGEPLSDYDPQENALALIGTADGKAVATRGKFAHRSRLMWWWKDRIDRKFMRQFEEVAR